MKLEDAQLKNELKQLSHVAPRADFVSESRMRLLAAPQHPAPQAAFMSASRPSFFQSSLHSAAFAVASIFIVAGLYLATQELSPLFLPGLNQKKITAEAEMIDHQIDIQLSQLDYFKNTSQESANALQQVSTEQLDHLNEALIENEAQAVTQSPAASGGKDANDEVIDLLRALAE